MEDRSADADWKKRRRMAGPACAGQGGRLLVHRSMQFSLLMLTAAMSASGCHTSLRRPPAVCQCAENLCGDAVDAVGRCTPISNRERNHHVTRVFRGCAITRHMGECAATGGPHWCD